MTTSILNYRFTKTTKMAADGVTELTTLKITDDNRQIAWKRKHIAAPLFGRGFERACGFITQDLMDGMLNIGAKRPNVADVKECVVALLQDPEAIACTLEFTPWSPS